MVVDGRCLVVRWHCETTTWNNEIDGKLLRRWYRQQRTSGGRGRRRWGEQWMEGDTEVGGTPDAWIAKQSRHHRPRCLAVIKQDLYGGCGCEVVEVTSCHGCKGRLPCGDTGVADTKWTHRQGWRCLRKKTWCLVRDHGALRRWDLPRGMGGSISCEWSCCTLAWQRWQTWQSCRSDEWAGISVKYTFFVFICRCRQFYQALHAYIILQKTIIKKKIIIDNKTHLQTTKNFNKNWRKIYSHKTTRFSEIINS